MPTKVRGKAGAGEACRVCGAQSSGDMFAGDMAVTVEMHHTGDLATRAEIVALLEHLLGDRPGDWRVSIVGSQANDRWEMKITRPRMVLSARTLWKDRPGSTGRSLFGSCSVSWCRDRYSRVREHEKMKHRAF